MSTIEALIDISLCCCFPPVSVPIFFYYDYTLSFVPTKLPFPPCLFLGFFSFMLC